MHTLLLQRPNLPAIDQFLQAASNENALRTQSHALNDDIPLNSPLYEALPSKVIRAIRSDLQQEISI